MKAENINTVQDMKNFVEGCINDFESGIATKEETLSHFKDYTFRIIDIVSPKINQEVARTGKLQVIHKKNQ